MLSNHYEQNLQDGFCESMAKIVFGNKQSQCLLRKAKGVKLDKIVPDKGLLLP